MTWILVHPRLGKPRWIHTQIWLHSVGLSEVHPIALQFLTSSNPETNHKH